MKGIEFKKIRKKLGLSREELASLLGLSGYNAVSNIELELRNPSKLAGIVMRILNALPKKRADELITLMRKYKE